MSRVVAVDELVIQGNVGIGITHPAQKLHVAGAILATDDITAFSDLRMKTNLEPIRDALNKIQNMNGYTYELIANPGNRKMGVIAQEVQAVLPEVVTTQSDGMLSVAYGNLVAVCIEAIKELKNEIETLKQGFRPPGDAVFNSL